MRGMRRSSCANPLPGVDDEAVSARRSLSRFLATLLLLCSVASLADIPPPDTSSCRDKAVKQSCVTDSRKQGTCEKSSCSRRDYSSGMPPKSVSYECLRCVEAGAREAAQPRPDAGT